MLEARRPLIFDIHRFALDDGPGIRTTVFLKGCPLACLWCHNPEGMHSEPELHCQAQKCIACGDCVSNCPQGAIRLAKGIAIDRSRCDGCGKCVDPCPTQALTIKGQYYPQSELIDLLLRDRRFFDDSAGGVTFSGGEPTLHMFYLKPILQALKAHGIHTAVQTCGLFNWDPFQSELLPWIDLIYFDIKCIDPHLHKQWTGRSNRCILANFTKLVEVAREKIVCSVPLIAGLTADKEIIWELAYYIGAKNNLPYRLLPYHTGGRLKNAALGRMGTLDPDVPLLAVDEYHHIAAIFNEIVSGMRGMSKAL